MLTSLKKCIKNPSRIFPHALFILNTKGLLKWVPDSLLLKIQFKSECGYPLDLKNPRTFNEKIQWQKLYGNLQQYTNLVDKYEVREYVSNTIGKDYLIPLLGVWDKFEDIDFDKLPNQFVLKCNHDSGSVIICTDKATFDMEKAKSKLKKCLKQNFYYPFREPQYKKIKPKILCEEYVVDKLGRGLNDYKIFCFNGTPKIIQINFDRLTSHKRNLYDINLNYIPVAIAGFHTNPNMPLHESDELREMLSLAAKMSENIPHVRVDFYSSSGQIYFGELTFTSDSGLAKFEPKEFDFEMGSWFELPKKKS